MRWLPDSLHDMIDTAVAQAHERASSIIENLKIGPTDPIEDNNPTDPVASDPVESQPVTSAPEKGAGVLPVKPPAGPEELPTGSDKAPLPELGGQTQSMAPPVEPAKENPNAEAGETTPEPIASRENEGDNDGGASANFVVPPVGSPEEDFTPAPSPANGNEEAAAMAAPVEDNPDAEVGEAPPELVNRDDEGDNDSSDASAASFDPNDLLDAMGSDETAGSFAYAVPASESSRAPMEMPWMMDNGDGGLPFDDFAA